MSHPRSDFMVRYLTPLVDCKVTEVKPSEDPDFTTIVFLRPNGETFNCELSSDAEGNAYLNSLSHYIVTLRLAL